MSDKNTKNVPGPTHGNNKQRVLAEAQVSLPDEMDIELIDAFIAESRNMLTIAENALSDLETDPGNMEAVDAVFRTFHNIKGTSAFFEISVMTKMAHHAESFLNLMRNGKIRYSEYGDLAMRTVEMFNQLFNSLENAMAGKSFIRPRDYDDLLHFLINPKKFETRKLKSGGKASESPTVPEKSGDILHLPSARSAKKRPAEKKKTTDAAVFQSPEPIDKATKQADAASLMDIARGLRGDHAQNTGEQAIETSIRVSVERLDRFIDMVGELVVSHSMVAQHDLITGSHHHDLLKKVSHTSKIVRELQNMSMSMRTVPLRATFRRMGSLVKELSRKLGKNITFAVQGEDTEVDRNMISAINDPLIHIIRNAVDHGIERPEVRVKAGKPPYGTVKLSAYHSAGNVIMKIEDDGRGFDRKAILRKASERGLISDMEADSEDVINDQDVFNLIFLPGFSTAKIISEVSGRGMGMDVVKRNIESLRGHVEVKSVAKKGSVFKMSLPLTLAIIDGMVVRVGDEKYVIPTISIVRSVRPEPKDISTVIGRGELLSVQEKLIPLFRLADIFGIEGSQYDPARSIVVVIEDDEHHVGILVDELIGTQQIVIKTLGETMGSVPGISGSAIMPNGRVGLILDVGKLMGLVVS